VFEWLFSRRINAQTPLAVQSAASELFSGLVVELDHSGDCPMPNTRSTGSGARARKAPPPPTRRANGRAASELDELTYRGEQLLHDFEETVSRSPLTAAAIALAIGFVIGRLWR
jgi:hypothetical protein